MTTIALQDWKHSPAITVGQNELRRLTTAALTDVSNEPDHVDFLLYELDRATIVDDAMLPADVIRLGSIVRYRSATTEERTINLVLPSEVEQAKSYRLSVTSMHGAALLGLRPNQTLSWLSPDGKADHVEVLKVANTNGH
jgi:regulator of nucleoside diphosphate kinase